MKQDSEKNNINSVDNGSLELLIKCTKSDAK